MGWFWAWVDRRWGERILFADEPRGWPGKLAAADPARVCTRACSEMHRFDESCALG